MVGKTAPPSAKSAARGDLLVFVDADTIVTPSAVRAALEATRDGAVGGGCRFRFDDPIPRYGRMLAAVAGPLYRALRLASGCFLFCTREAFAAAGGFDETLLVAEELAMSRALRRQGRFVILRQSVTTSGRKLRAYSGREMLGMLASLLVSGQATWRQRTGLELWYGERRADPAHPRERDLLSARAGRRRATRVSGDRAPRMSSLPSRARAIRRRTMERYCTDA